MKYKERKSLCATNGCARVRRKNGRYCRECHAESMREYRHAKAEEKVKRLVKATVCGRRGMTPEMKTAIEELAAKVARQIDELNGKASACGRQGDLRRDNPPSLSELRRDEGAGR